MDTLSALLSLLYFRSSIDVRCRLQGKWQLPHKAGLLDDIYWHALLAGSARLEMPGGETRTLHCGSVVILPQGAAHRLLYHKENAHLLCGRMQIDPSARHFLTALPETLVYHEADPWLLTTLHRLHDESMQPRPGQQALCDQISLTLLTLTLRRWLESEPEHSGLLSAMLHPRLGAAITAMLKQPEESWTVARLAQLTHMSRASFARQFQQLTNTTPLRLLTEIRMACAAAIISRQPLTLSAVAEQAGYASESAFHKAFVRHTGLTPGDYRKQVLRVSSGKAGEVDETDDAE